MSQLSRLAGHSCRGAGADPHGLVDHGDSPVALRRGGLCPCVQVQRVFCRETRCVQLIVMVMS